MLRRLVTTSTILLLVALVASAESGFVEGTVFNKRTGAPLENAVVTLTSFDGVCNAQFPRSCTRPTVGNAARTDGNGFYSIEISEPRLAELIRAGILGRMRAVAECARGDRIESSDPNAHTIPASATVEIRNLYIDVRGRRPVFRCDTHPSQLVPLPRCDSLPPPPVDPGAFTPPCIP